MLVALFCVTSYGLLFAYAPLAMILPANADSADFLLANAAVTKFFWLPFRLFEFGLGAATIFLLDAFSIPNTSRYGLVQVAGLLLILASAVLFTERTNAEYLILPCIGAVLVIIGGDKHPVSIALTNSVMQYIGTISYSLYLVHWPLVVFYCYLTLHELDVYERIALSAAMIALAQAMYWFVERSYRNTTFSLPSLAAILGGVGATATSVGMLLWASFTGWPWRYDATITNFDVTALQQQTVQYAYKKVTSNPFDDGIRILVIGDSHGGDVSNGLHQLLGNKYSIRYVSLSSFCLHYLKDNLEGALKDINCKDSVSMLQSSSLIAKADRIILTFDWLPMTAPYAENLPAFLLKKKGSLNGVLLLGADIHFKNFPELALRSRDPDKMNRMAAKIDLTEKIQIDQHLANVAEFSAIRFRKKIPLMCSAEICDFMSPNIDSVCVGRVALDA